MALSQYQRNNTNGLIFFIDAANPRSFRGEVTTNYINYNNSLPTYGFNYGSYNTNQYFGDGGGGTYFSIGTVSVSNNIVTHTSRVGTLRTYDVLRPQTSGGGVTAGTDYYIKRIADNQFSLHQYSSSRIGFRVTAPVLRDERISISSSGFPTMWWGAPHLNNSGNIVTIVPNGFNYDGRIHDCLRINFHRAGGVDGMAYGYNPSVPNRDTQWTWSCYMRVSNPADVGKSIYWQSYSIANSTTFATVSSPPLTTEWQRVSMTGTPYPGSSGSSNLIPYWFSNSGGNWSVDIAEIQLENNSYPRPWVIGSRATGVTGGDNDQFETNGEWYGHGGWSDLSASNLNGYIQYGNPRWRDEYGGVLEFDGDDGFYFPVDSSATSSQVRITDNFNTHEHTIIVWAKTDALSQNGFWFEKGSVNNQYSLFQEGGNIVYRTIHTDGNTNSQYTTTSSYLNTTDYFQVAGTYNKLQKITYVNGTAVTTGNETRPLNFNSAGVYIGQYGSGGYLYDGRIAIVQVYNRALSAAEIAENYNKYKSRFGLS